MLRFLSFVALAVCSAIAAAQPTFIPDGPAIEVADGDFGNLSPRMVLNAAGEPVVFFGSSGAYRCAMWNAAASAFNAPVTLVESGVFLSDSEGPRVASHGDTMIVTYMISGDWNAGARGLVSLDAGATWSDPFPLTAPNATVDHFMPVPAFDGSGMPFAGIKVGDAPDVFEGILRPVDDMTGPWLDPVSGSDEADGDAVCECCPSAPFFASGRYWNVVRNNNGNVRDMWLLGSEEEEPTSWPIAVDIDPTDWVIGGCPATGASVAGPTANGEHWAAFMSAGGDGGQARVYLARMDLENFPPSALETGLAGPTQFTNSTQNHPSLSATSDLIALAWEQNTAGYDIYLSLSGSDGSGLFDGAVNLTESLGGQHRMPTVQLAGETVHLIWKNSMTGAVHYLRGNTSGLQTANSSVADPQPRIISCSAGTIQLDLPASWFCGSYLIFDIDGRQVSEGALNSSTIPGPGEGVHILRLAHPSGVRVWSGRLMG